MSSREDLDTPPVAAPAPEQAPPAALYPGDRGELPEPARRVLVQLLAGPSLDARRHRRLWPALLRHEAAVRSRLADLFLDLVLDGDSGVAFTRQADTDDLDAPRLLRRSPLTFLESVLLLYLRQLLVEAETQARRAVVSEAEMLEQMKLYERSQSTDQAGFERRVKAAIEKVKRNSLVSPIRGSEGRYEVSATLKLLFSADEVAALAERYANLRDERTGVGD